MSRLVAVVFLMQLFLCGCGAHYYRNSTGAGPTVADEDAIVSITKAATVLATLSEQELTALAQETASASLQYAGLKKLETGSFEFACWLPCNREAKILAASGAHLLTLKGIEGPTPDGGRIHEQWAFDGHGEIKRFDVGFTYSAGGGGDSIISAFLNRKPDLFRISRQ